MVIEFAFVAFVFFLINWGIFEFGRAFYVRNSIQQITRCMAREAVVFRPSNYGAAKENCLLNNTWPLYSLVPGDLTDAFTIRYLTNGGTATEADVAGGTYNPGSGDAARDQVLVCPNGSNCIRYVQAYVNPATYQEFGLLRSWFADSSSDTIVESVAATTMPAESMGYAPP